MKKKEISQVIFSAQKSCCTLSSSWLLANSWHSLCQLCPFSLCNLHTSYSWAWTRRKVVVLVNKGCVFGTSLIGVKKKLGGWYNVSCRFSSSDIFHWTAGVHFWNVIWKVWIYNLFQKSNKIKINYKRKDFK